MGQRQTLRNRVIPDDRLSPWFGLEGSTVSNTESATRHPKLHTKMTWAWHQNNTKHHNNITRTLQTHKNQEHYTTMTRKLQEHDTLMTMFVSCSRFVCEISVPCSCQCVFRVMFSNCRVICTIVWHVVSFACHFQIVFVSFCNFRAMFMSVYCSCNFRPWCHFRVSFCIVFVECSCQCGFSCRVRVIFVPFCVMFVPCLCICVFRVVSKITENVKI